METMTRTRQPRATRPSFRHEERLRALYAQIVEGERAQVEARTLLAKMWDEGRGFYTHQRLAELATEGTARVGGDAVSEGAIHKVLWRRRRSGK